MQLLQEQADLGWVVLEIPVHCDYELPVRVIETGD
jgi:hypothetical protein